MPAVQSTYAEQIRPALAGMRANEEPVDIISRNLESVGGVVFGKVVQQGVRDDGCITDLNTSAMDAFKFLGIVMRTRDVRPDNPNGFAQYDAVPIMRKGVIWVTTDAAVTAGTDVTVTLATGGLGTAAVAAGVVQIPNARWESSTTGAALAKLRLG